jgi:sugar-specific transcriptional regulator TrmB
MIVKKEFLNKLKDFNLNSYEAKLWTALLSRGVSTAGELADIANVPRSRSYDVLESLEKKGFIVMKIGKPIKYIAVPPGEVLERVKKKIEDETEEQITSLNKIRKSEVIKELDLLYKQGIDLIDPTDLSGSLKGRNNLYTHVESIIKNAQKSVVIMTSAEGLLRKIDAFKKTFQKLKEKGVKIRIAAPIEKLPESAISDLEDVAELRHSKDIKGRFIIVDDQQLVFMPVDDAEVHPSYDIGIWISAPYFASTMLSMFDTVWRNSKEVEAVVKIK